MCQLIIMFGYNAETLSKIHAKTGQRNAEIKDCFVDDTE